MTGPYREPAERPAPTALEMDRLNKELEIATKNIEVGKTNVAHARWTALGAGVIPMCSLVIVLVVAYVWTSGARQESWRTCVQLQPSKMAECSKAVP